METTEGSGMEGTTAGSTAESDIAGQEVHFIKGRTNQETVKLFDEVGREFKRETGAILNAEYSGMGAGRWQRMIQLLQAGNPPEVGVSQLSNAISLWRQEALEPVTGVMERLVEKHDAPPDATRFIKNGEEWMVPWSVGYGDMWYRQDLVSQAGLGSDFVPDTWDKWRQYANAVSNNTEVNGVYVPASVSEPTMATLISVLRSNNGQITRHDGNTWKIAFGQGQHRTRMVETLTYLKEMHDNYSVDAGGAGWNEVSNSIAFKVGASTWFPGSRPKNHVGHHDQSKGFASEVVDVGHTPAGRSKKGRASVGPMVVFKDAENPEAGKRFLEFLMGSEEYAARLCWADAPVHCQPPFPGIKQGDFFQNLLSQLPDHWGDAELERHLFEAPKHGVVSAFETDPPNPYMGTILTSLKLAEMVNASLIKGTAPGDAVDQYASEMSDVLNRAKGQ